jgi:hypothetical protein
VHWSSDNSDWQSAVVAGVVRVKTCKWTYILEDEDGNKVQGSIAEDKLKLDGSAES